LPGGRKIQTEVSGTGNWANPVLGANIPSEQVVELLLLRCELIRQVERLVLSLGEASLDLEAVGFQHNLMRHVIAGHSVQLAIGLDGFLNTFERALGLQDSIVAPLDLVNRFLLNQSQHLSLDIAGKRGLLDIKPDSILLRERLENHPGEAGCKPAIKADGEKGFDSGKDV